MTIDTIAAPGAAASTAAPESLANEQGLANPADQTTTQGDGAAKPPKTEEQRAIERMERRIGNVTRSRYEAEARAQQAIERAERLERQLQERQQAQQPNDGTQSQGEQRAAPRPEDIEQRVEQRAAEVATVREAAARANKVFEAGTKEFGADAFKNSVSIVQEEAGPLYQRNGMPTALGEAITDADNPAALLHHLGQNPEIAEELKGLTAAQLGRRIARIEASIATSNEPKASNAPKPLAPVKGAGGGTGDPSPSSPDYMAWKLKQLRGR